MLQTSCRPKWAQVRSGPRQWPTSTTASRLTTFWLRSTPPWSQTTTSSVVGDRRAKALATLARARYQSVARPSTISGEEGEDGWFASFQGLRRGSDVAAAARAARSDLRDRHRYRWRRGPEGPARRAAP